MRVAAAVLLLALAACGDDTGTASTPEETPVTTGNQRVDAAVADLAERESVDPAEISVVDMRDVTWSDGSLGCPKPGMMYTQALVDGYLAVLEVAGQRYEYHGGRSGDLTYCDAPQPPAEGGR